MTAKYALLDTNLLVLFMVGGTNPEFISIHKNCSRFTIDDYGVLLRHLSVSASIVTTTQILSETANLLRQVRDPIKTEIAAFFQFFIMQVEELRPTARTAVSDPAYLWLGLNDAAILKCLGPNRVLITEDGNLHAAAIDRSNGALHFAELRLYE